MTINTVDFSIYVCPKCKGKLILQDQELICRACQLAYPIVEGIPDFILEDLTKSTTPALRRIKIVDRMASSYETMMETPLVAKLFGLGPPSAKELWSIEAGMVEIESGLILDAACGPGSVGRRLASPLKTVYGVDISMGMLRQGVDYVERGHIPNVHFARAKVEELPFQNALFDAVVFSGALHAFADPKRALNEIGRAMKEGAQLVLMDMVADKGVFRFRWMREYFGIHAIHIEELENYLLEVGFGDVRSQVYNSYAVFSSRKHRV